MQRAVSRSASAPADKTTACQSTGLRTIAVGASPKVSNAVIAVRNDVSLSVTNVGQDPAGEQDSAHRETPAPETTCASNARSSPYAILSWMNC
jgi:hypothetical protein